MAKDLDHVLHRVIPCESCMIIALGLVVGIALGSFYPSLIAARLLLYWEGR